MPVRQLHHGRVTWFDITQVTPADVEMLGKKYSYIHPLHLGDLMSPSERPKLDLEDNYLFAVLHIPLWDNQKRLSRPYEIDVIVGRGYVVTVHDGALKPMSQLFDNCSHNEAELTEMLGHGASHTFYVILDQLIDYLIPILRKVDFNIRTIEENIFTDDARRIIRDIAVVRRDIIALRRIIRHQVPVLEALEKTNHTILHEDMEEYFGDILDHLYRARDIIDEDYEVISGLSDTASQLASYRINEVMRILTVMSVIMLPLTLLSSIYGMNIDLPLDHRPDAFILVSGSMIALAITMLLIFRSRRWL